MVLKSLEYKNITFTHLIFVVADYLNPFAFCNKNNFHKIMMMFNLGKIILMRNIFHAVYFANINCKRMILKIVIAFRQLHLFIFGSKIQNP